MEIVNRKAKFDYFIEREIEAGIELKGTEIKSLRKGSADLKDSYIRIKNNVIDDFMNYARIKCSSVDTYNTKFNKDYSIAYLEETRFINDMNNGRRK